MRTWINVARLLCCLATFTTQPLQASIPDSERAVLDAFYQQTGGPGWTTRTNWEGPRGTECTWYGVGCDAAQTHVRWISFGSNNLVGTLPAISDLTYLEIFYSSYNPQLKGSIPPIRGLVHLKTFVVDFDQLSGNIPVLENLPSLQSLDLSFNRLTGSIPDLSGAPNLVIIGLEDNELTGNIPDIGGLFYLQQFAVGNNALTGNVPLVPPPFLVPGVSTLCNNALNHTPDSLWDAATGESPWYQHCTLGQPGVVAIPLSERAVLDAIFGQTNGVLWTRGFSYTNHVGWAGEYGTECSWYGVACTSGGDHIAGVSLPANNLAGPLPSLANLPYLQSIDFSSNKLTGNIPSLAGLPIRSVNLSNNAIVNQIPSIAGLTSLSSFQASHNQLTGEIPALTGLPNLSSLDVGANQLSGNIPDLSLLPSIRVLNVANNQLVGAIPPIATLGQLESVDFSHNQLTGGIPSISTSVQHFSAAYNRLTGNIPSLNNLSLTAFDIGFNGVTGDPPSPPLSLSLGGSRLCNNPLNHVANPVWDAATGSIPWYANCTSAFATLSIMATDSDVATGINTTIAVSISNGKALPADSSGANAGTSTISDGNGKLICFLSLDITGKGSCDAILPSNTTENLTASYSGSAILAAASVGFSKTTPVAVPGNLDQHGWTGAWYNPATSGQGIVFEVYPDVGGPGTGLLAGGWFTYDTVAGGEDHKRWYTLLGPVSSSSASAKLDVLATTGGNFNAGPIITSGNGKQVVGSATLNFTDCQHGELTYSFSTPDSRQANVPDRVGRIPLTRLDSNVTCDPTNGAGNGTPPGKFLLSGAWYTPATSGQGLLFDINPVQNITFAAWYTFAQNGQSIGGGASQRWYTMQIGSSNVGTSSLDNIGIFSSQGGVFDALAPVTTPQVGTASIVFNNCNSLVLNYSFTAGSNAGLSGSINLTRAGPTPAGCSL